MKHDRKTKRDTLREAENVGFLKAIWDFFSSMKTAIVLLLVLAVTSIAGTVIPQERAAGELTQRYGPVMYTLMHALVLDNMYNSWWYVGLLALVGINLAVCSLNRFRATWRSLSSPKVVASEKQISLMQRSEQFNLTQSAADTADAVETALRSASYQVLEAKDGDESVFYAAKGRLSIWGPYLTHVSILIVFLGAIIGGKFGVNGVAMVREGGDTDTFYANKSDASQPLGFRLSCADFRIGYDKDHNPTSYNSDLRVYKGGKVVASRVIDVNHPFSYKGFSFYQSDFGLDSVVIRVTAPNGESRSLEFGVDTQDSSHGRQYSLKSATGDMAFEQFVIGGKRLTIFAHDFAPDYAGGTQVSKTDLPLNPAVLIMVNDRMPAYKGMDAWTKLGWLTAGKKASYKGFTISVEKVIDYTVLQVGRNPGLPLVYLGFVLMLFGVFVSFYVTRKVMRVRISQTGSGSTAVIGGTSRSDESVFDGDFDRLRDALQGR